jgi:hypothetical protein
VPCPATPYGFTQPESTLDVHIIAGLMLDAGGTMRALFVAATAVAIVSFAALRHIDRRARPSLSSQP